MQPPPLLLLRLGVGVASPVKPQRLLPNSPSLPRCRCRCRRSWFSNAEPGPAGDDASNTRRWWSDADDQLEDDDFDDDGGGFGGAAGELFDEPWFSKVFKAYGYVLPVILASMLVATGPQAFLMAMAIPLAQSAISFALRSLSTAFRGRDQQDYYYSDYADDFEASSSSSYSYRDSSSSWSPETAGDASSSSSSSNTKTQSAGFGGWDELDGDEHHGRSRSSSSSSSSSNINDDVASASAVRRRPASASRMGNSRYRQAPLLMRLLVAVFPFLGSWFRML